jgi:hypothetical protein
MAVVIGGKPFWLWRAVDSEGEVLDLLVQRRRNKGSRNDADRPRQGYPRRNRQTGGK